MRNCLKKKNDEKKRQTKLVKIKNKCLLPPWMLMIIQCTIGSLILAQHNTWHLNENGSPLTNPLFHWRYTWEMTPFWRPLAKGASRPQCKLEVEWCLQPPRKLFIFPKWKTISFPLTNSFQRAWKWSLTRMVVRWIMSMELLWRKHEGRKTCIFSTSMFERKMWMSQSLWMNELRFGTKDSVNSTWWVSKSWKIWSLAWTWNKCHCTMCVKLALKATIKGHIFLKMKRPRLRSFWSLCITMCLDWWRPHLIMQHNTLSLLLTTFQEKLMFTFWKQKERCLKNSRPWWRIKLAWKSKPCDSIMKESLCPKKLMTFCVNVESNNKQVHLIHHNKMELWNQPTRPSWGALKAWFVHNNLTWSFGLRWCTWWFTSKIDA